MSLQWQDDRSLNGAKVFDMDAQSQLLLVSGRPPDSMTSSGLTKVCTCTYPFFYTWFYFIVDGGLAAHYVLNGSSTLFLSHAGNRRNFLFLTSTADFCF